MPHEKPPTPDQLRLWLKARDISASAAARLVGLDHSKFRLYLIDEGKRGHRPCPFSVWYTLTDRVAKGEHLIK
jgi:hypothetical protein